MTAPEQLGDVDATIAGQRAGERCVHVHRDRFADPDRLVRDLLDVAEADGQRLHVTPRLRGFCRAVGKALETSRP